MHLTYNKGRGSSSSSAHVCIIKEVYSEIGSKHCLLNHLMSIPHGSLCAILLPLTFVSKFGPYGFSQ